MSLREEIERSLHRIYFWNPNAYSVEEIKKILTDDIISIFEKRIDILKQKCNGIPDCVDAYNKVKEMLKY